VKNRDAPPTPMMSLDGKYRWDGYRWISARPSIPWQVTVAEVLVFVEAAVVWCLGVLLVVGFGALGLIVNSDNGGSGLPAVAHFLGLLLLATLAIVGVLISMAIVMVRKRWARWVIAVIQVLFVAYVVGDTIYYLAVIPGQSVQTDLLLSLVYSAIPLLILTLLLHPTSRHGQPNSAVQGFNGR
jgi:hypothetical protein